MCQDVIDRVADVRTSGALECKLVCAEMVARQLHGRCWDHHPAKTSEGVRRITWPIGVLSRK